MPGIADVIERFITHPAPAGLSWHSWAQMRDRTRSNALAHLLGDLADLVEAGCLDAESVTAAVDTALTMASEQEAAEASRAVGEA